MQASIIITTYNRKEYFKTALVSAIYQKNISPDDYEILVVEDGSNYAEQVINNEVDIGPVTVRLLHQEHNQGRSRTVNNGFKNAAGKYITLLDDDDIILPHKISILSEWLDDHPDYQMVCSMGKGIDEAGVEQPKYSMSWQMRAKTNGITLENMLRGNFINGVTTMYRAEGLGLFDESLLTAEEYDFHLRLLYEEKKIGFVEEYTGLYRFHAFNKSKRMWKEKVAARTVEEIKKRYST